MLSKCTLQTVPCIGLHFNAFQKGMEKVEVVSAVFFSLLLSPEQIISFLRLAFFGQAGST